MQRFRLKYFILLFMILQFLGCDNTLEVPTYTVTYDGNSNTGGRAPTDPNSHEAGVTVVVLGNNESLTKDNCTFEGWMTAPDKQESEYSAGETLTMPNHNLTLYAYWYNSSIDISTYSTAEKANILANYTEAERIITDMSQSEIDALISELNSLATDTTVSDSNRMQAYAAITGLYILPSSADNLVEGFDSTISDCALGENMIYETSDMLDYISSASVNVVLNQLDALLRSISFIEAYGNILGQDGGSPIGENRYFLSSLAYVVGIISQSSNTTAEIAAAIVAGTTSSIDLPTLSEIITESGIRSIFGDDLSNTIMDGQLMNFFSFL